MPTPSGRINFSDIESEFGRNGSKSLGAYRISQSAGLYSNLPLDTGVPQSGPISFSQLGGKRLNIVVDISGGDEYRVNMRSKYDNNSGITVIGGFRSKPADPSQKRILVSVNKKIGSGGGSTNNVALRTGTWGTSAILEVLLGPSARIIGSGGNGGDFVATTSSSTQTGTIISSSGYFANCGGKSGGLCLYPFNRKSGVYDDPPFGGTWTSEYYPGNFVSQGKRGYYEARRDWTATVTSTSFTANGGSSGSSALGIDYQTTLTNNGYIQNGFGGGGAGGYATR